MLSLMRNVPKLRIKLEMRLKPYLLTSKEGYVSFSSHHV